MKNPVAALQQAFGSAPEAITIRGLLETTRAWLDGRAPIESLVGGVAVMLPKLEQAASATRQDLRQQGHLEEGLRVPIERSLAAYEELHAVLLELEQSLSEDHREQVEAAWEDLAEAAQELSEANADMEEWLADPAPRCLNCGEAEADPCPGCGLELLRPDRQSAFGGPFETTVLPGEFAEVATRLQQVLSGQATLSTLWPPLTRLQSLLCNFLAAAQAAAREQDSSALGEFVVAIEDALDGIELMDRCARSRATADLRSGWAEVFAAGQEVAHGRRALLEEFAGPEEAAAYAPNQAIDSVILSRDK
ncbi:MAG: hypothetical protein KC910_02685 [Candidatus Eremiobacteraeota bacterium]|nr:hypothetical protein [Candidatus Eremiobacteraeota bacterium]